MAKGGSGSEAAVGREREVRVRDVKTCKTVACFRMPQIIKINLSS